jgi:hypothetical protein
MNNGIVLHKLKMVYWYIPKVACTTLKIHFADLCGLPYDKSDGIEIDPKYCQIILERMLKLDPSLEVRKNGELWETTNKQRSFAKSG